MTRPLLSLVVLGFRNFEVTTKACLESLRPWFGDKDIEILVVDNGSIDGSAEKTADWCVAHPSVQCLLSDSNRGFAGGMNWGVSHARGQWILLVNNDTVFPEYTLDALKRVIREAPDNVAMLGPVTNAAGNGQRLWKPDATASDWLKIGQWLNTNPTHHLIPTYRCDFFCIAIRHDVWLELEGLDLAFGLGYYEDFDFSLRLRKAGYEQMITEDVFVLHVGSATFQGSKVARKLIKVNKKLLQMKHPDARFEHTRLGNFVAIDAQLKIKRKNQWTLELNERYLLRVHALKQDAPKSLIKRFLWNRKINKMQPC
jgi:GT2 family glycosyltransferase